jgi:hypothetical protein
MKEYFEYIERLNLVYFERETILAFNYFKDRNNVPFFYRINRGNRHWTQAELTQIIDNMAWDMVALRYLERLCGVEGKGEYFLPFFLSNDAALKSIMSYYPVKGVIINRLKGNVHSIANVSFREYMITNGCEDLINDFFSEERVLQRGTRVPPSNMELKRMIILEINKLSAILA